MLRKMDQHIQRPTLKQNRLRSTAKLTSLRIEYEGADWNHDPILIVISSVSFVMLTSFYPDCGGS